MITPPTGITSPPTAGALDRDRKRRAPRPLVPDPEASPVLGGSKGSANMQRTPQTNLTQTKLTGFGVTQGPPMPPVQAQAAPPADVRGAEVTGGPSTQILEPINMDTTPAPVATCGNSQVVTTDFLLKSLQENTNQIIKSFTAHLGALSQRVDVNASKIESNSADITKNAREITSQGKDIERLASKIRDLEESAGARVPDPHRRASLGPDYLWARRSLRLWPIQGRTDEEMWEAVGDFIHDTLRVPESDISQGDIAEVVRVLEDAVPGSVVDEVVVTFQDKKARDTIMGHAVNLASHVGHDGKPTAGIRLEIPSGLMDTFRLLSRFGTRLRARHGEGTKRHIKFDDYTGSLFSNIKLPGDESWTRVTPDMARQDLEASLKEENTFHQRRMAAKLVPGPRERLGRPPLLPPSRSRPEDGTVARSVVPVPGPSRQQGSGPPDGKRPRWTAPERGLPPRRHV